MADTTSGFFEEPPHVHVEAEPSCPRPPEGTDRLETPQNKFTDSGYGDFLEACDCNCHFVFEIDEIVNGIIPPRQSVTSVLTTCRQIQAVAETVVLSTLIYGISAVGKLVVNQNNGTLILGGQPIERGRVWTNPASNEQIHWTLTGMREA